MSDSALFIYNQNACHDQLQIVSEGTFQTVPLHVIVWPTVGEWPCICLLGHLIIHCNSNREWVTALFFQLGSLISLHAHSLWATTLFSSVILFHLIKGSGWHLFLLSYFIKSHPITNSKWVYIFSAYCMALYITFHSHDNQIVSPFISPGSVITSHHMANSG